MLIRKDEHTQYNSAPSNVRIQLIFNDWFHTYAFCKLLFERQEQQKTVVPGP